MAVIMTRVDPLKNMARFYEIDIQPTLFGDFAVVRNWGRIGAAGSTKSLWFSSEDTALENASRLERSKRRRGYLDPHLSS